ncbi:MAG: NUDIX hydrolase [Candidatus Levybacteria bacterium]|nr:NUDIX hydrolase [Candidatus Levybacteria bacterium]
MKEKVYEVHSRVTFETAEFSIREDTVIHANGQQEIHEILQSPEGVLILPLTREGNIILTKEYRHNHGLVYGVPMGKKEKNDINPLAAAKREIKEEVGLSATKWTLVSTHYNGIHEEGYNYFYIAEGLLHGDHKHDVDENIEKVEMTFEDAFKLMDEGKIVDLPSRACIWAGYIHVQNRSK